jgi:hypothetical protein
MAGIACFYENSVGVLLHPNREVEFESWNSNFLSFGVRVKKRNYILRSQK